jgi:hypothetical protein
MLSIRLLRRGGPSVSRWTIVNMVRRDEYLTYQKFRGIRNKGVSGVVLIPMQCITGQGRWQFSHKFITGYRAHVQNKLTNKGFETVTQLKYLETIRAFVLFNIFVDTICKAHMY